MKLKLVLFYFFVLTVYFRSCTGALYVSQCPNSWNNIAMNQALLDYDYFQQHGWSSIMDVIPEDEEFWIAARATATPFVSWEGCARWLGGPNCTKEIKQGGSIADCLRKCPQYPVYILLQGEKCRCVESNDSDSITCFEGTSIHHCNNPCPNNTNDRCGGTHDMFVSVYFRDQFPIELEKENASKKDCVFTRGSSGENPTWGVTTCYHDDYMRRYICNGLILDNVKFLSWAQAFEKCGESRSKMGFEHSDLNERRQSYWTSLRRSFEIDWLPTLDETHSGCVTVMRDSLDQLIVQVDDCTRSHRYLYMYMPQDPAGTSDTIGACSRCSLTYGQLVGAMFGTLVLGLGSGVALIVLLQKYRILDIGVLCVKGTESNDFYPMQSIQRNRHSQDKQTNGQDFQDKSCSTQLQKRPTRPRHSKVKQTRDKHFNDMTLSRNICTEGGRSVGNTMETYQDLDETDLDINYDPLQTTSSTDEFYYTNA